MDIDDTEAFEKEIEEAVLNSLEDSELVSLPAQSTPNNLTIFPLNKRPLFPGMAAPIAIEPGPYYEALKNLAKSKDKCVALLLTKEEDADIYKIKFKDYHPVGVLGRILRIIPLEQGGAQVIFNIERRLQVKSAEPNRLGILVGKVKYFKEKTKLTKQLKAYAISIISTIKELLKLNPLFKEELQIFLGHSDYTEPGKLADFAVALTTASRDDLQDLLNTINVPTRIEKALKLLRKELDLSRLQNSITQKIEATISKSQKDYFLREQLKTIKRELGIERDDKSSDKEKFELRLQDRNVPDDVMKVISEELEKISALDSQSAEYAVSRGYLDWLTIIPWGIYSEEKHNLCDASKVLEDDHYGLSDIKKRILEFISVGKLAGGVKGSIICLVGPPGVGKTSIGRSIAHALNRKFYRFSVGGMRDEAEIKGHRRTYIGAMPGKMIQALKFCQTMNPVIMLDEVDKMGSSYHGDPASALLEVLDPEQNKEFLDHYLDVRCNLSEILFIVTANVLDTIPDPLKDRMDILRLSGYLAEEKVQIAKKYLIPRHRKMMGLKATQVRFSDKALRAIIEGYAREAGVRSVENQIKKIMRKVAMEIVSDEEKYEKKVSKRKKASSVKKPQLMHSITANNLKEYLGRPKFTTDRFYHQTPVGVCTGLAWTALGGATLYIETIKVPHEKGGMKLTGQAGDVMKESAQIAWSYLHSASDKYAPNRGFFKNSQVHIHIPEGATPKDGPSAGITMVTALLSLLLNKPVLPDLGMTGEVTLTGRVLSIGGMREKIVAAKRSGLKTLIFPKDNMTDFEELPDNLKKGIKFHFVKHYDEVFSYAFPKKK